MAITNWWVSLLAPVSKAYVNIKKGEKKKKEKDSRNLGFDDSSSGGRLNRLRIKKFQGWVNNLCCSIFIFKKISK